MQTLTFTASRRNDRVVILRSFNLESCRPSLSLSRRFARLGRLLLSALFSGRASAVVAVVLLSMMAAHSLTASSAIEAQHLMGLDCLLASPWVVLPAIRAARPLATPEEKGGRK